MTTIQGDVSQESPGVKALRAAAELCYTESAQYDKRVSVARTAGNPETQGDRQTARALHACGVAIDVMRASLAKEEVRGGGFASWIAISQKPVVGDDAEVVVRYEQDAMGRVHTALGWWCDGPGHFSVEGVENADHLLTHYMLLPKA